MDLLYFVRSAATTMITHHSRAATVSARRLRPASPQATLTRISTTAVRIALLFTLPFTLLALFVIRLSNVFRIQPHLGRQNGSPRQTVLLTSNSASNTLALTLARTLHGAGTTVAIAHSPSSSSSSLSPPSRFASLLSPILPPPTSFSAAVASSLRLRIPARRQRQEDGNAEEDDSSLYEHEVLGAILRVRPSVWVPCELLVDGVDGADAAVVREAVGLLRETLRREAERERPRVRCGVLAAEGPVVAIEDDGVFRRLVEELNCGVEVVGGKDVVVRRRGEVHGILHAGRKEGKRWELVEGGEVVQLPVGDDGCLNESYECLARLDISDARPWVMREVIEGEAYRIHAIVLSGAVQAFAVSTPDADEQAGRLFLSPSSPLHASIQAFVNAFVASLPGRPSLPLAIDLTVRTSPTATGTTTRIHPTRCSWNLLPLNAPPFSTAAAELVVSASPQPQQRSLPPPRQPDNDEPVPAAPPSPTTTASPPASPQPTKPTKPQSIPPPANVHTPPNSPVLNPLVTRFVASTLPPTPPSSPDSRRSRFADGNSSPPRSSLRRSKRDVSHAAVAAPVPVPAVRSSRCYACASPPRTSSDESSSSSEGRSSRNGGVVSRKAGRAKVRFEELPPPAASSSLLASSEPLELLPPSPLQQEQQQEQVRGDDEPSAAEKRTDGGRPDVTSADVVPGVAGTYSLPRTLWAYVLLPLLELLSLRAWPLRRGVVAVVQGAAVLVERVLLPGAWLEEGWSWRDAGPWVWEWGVRRVVGV